jgi:hypothetical protein
MRQGRAYAVARQLLGWLSDAQTVLVLVPPAVTASVGALVAADQGLSPLGVFGVGVGAYLAIAIAQSFFATFAWKVGSAAVVVALSLLFYVWAIDQYRLDFEHMQAHIDRAATPGGGATVRGIKLGLRLKNPNPFRIYWTSKLRVIAIGDRTSRVEQRIWGGYIDGGANNKALMDDGYVPVNAPDAQVPVNGRVFFIVCYGRDRNAQRWHPLERADG